MKTSFVRWACISVSLPAILPGMALAQETQGAPATTATPEQQPDTTTPVGETVTPDADAAPGGGDIVVTARKRTETLISVPVVVSAVPAAELERRAVVNLDGIARIVPQLLIAPQGGSVQGGNIAIRGISGPDSNPFGDQAVSFNIDGVQVAKANVRRMSDTDIAQVEVLKGPQALFFGKNSPAGIVSIRTADPTNSFAAKISAGYEFYAREIRTEGYASGPIGDTLGFRLAGIFSHQRGDLKDITPANSPYAPEHGHSPYSNDFALRGTLKWEPTPDFTARLKLNYAQTRNNGPQNTGAFIDCPAGVRQTVLVAQALGSTADYSQSQFQCNAGERITSSSSGPFVGTLPGTQNDFGDGQNFQHQKQMLGSLEMNYNLSDELTLTSVSGYYYVKLRQCQNYESDFAIILPSCNPSGDKEYSQELRLSSDYDGPLNFIGGVYYSKTTAYTGSITYLFGGDFDIPIAPGLAAGPTTPLLVNNYYLRQKGTAYSAYLQMVFKPIDVVEIDVGGRYSYEKKRVPLVMDGISTGTGAILNAGSIISVAKDKDSWKDFSPEVTLSYRPTDQLTVFGSYKHGFLSGGFNSSSVAFSPGLDISYDPQTIKGFEGGVKALTLDRTLRLNLAAYTYKVKDLQVTNFTNATSTIRNAGAVSIKGVEADFSYTTPLEGLSISGAVAYNKGKYTSFPAAPCYNGQTPAQGCNIVNGNPQQDLGGTELIRAPKWNLSGSFNYETPLGGALKLGLSGGVNYSSSFLTDATSAPQSRMHKYALVDATARIGDADDAWEIAVIGRNLTNQRYWVASPNVPFTGSGTGTDAGALGDRFASISRGREIMVRGTVKFGQ
jgi:iron complex outermembrane receptor protein